MVSIAAAATMVRSHGEARPTSQRRTISSVTAPMVIPVASGLTVPAACNTVGALATSRSTGMRARGRMRSSPSAYHMAISAAPSQAAPMRRTPVTGLPTPGSTASTRPPNPDTK